MNLPALAHEDGGWLLPQEGETTAEWFARVENENSPARILTPEEHARALEVASRRTAKLTPLSVLEGPESADDFAARREEARALSRGELGRSPWNAKVKERDDAITRLLATRR